MQTPKFKKMESGSGRRLRVDECLEKEFPSALSLSFLSWLLSHSP
jgi:hypothetical protein